VLAAFGSAALVLLASLFGEGGIAGGVPLRGSTIPRTLRGPSDGRGNLGGHRDSEFAGLCGCSSLKLLLGDRNRDVVIYLVIYHCSRKMLADAPSHDPRLAMIYRESFFEQDRCDVNGKVIHAFLKIFIAGKR